MERKDSVLIQNRQIRIFISSTFQDMQGERDYLMKKVFPVLKEKAAERDVSLVPLDLRWGITEQESKTGKVVEICLKEIENAYPFFIGLVGDRYGWCPKEEEINNIQDKYHWLQKDIELGLSVTEIEMQYGVLRNPHNLNAYFFLKESNQDAVENADKLSRLKNTILNNGRYPVSSYSTIEDLGSQVEMAFSQLIDRLFPKALESEEDRESIKHNSEISKLTQFYLPDQAGFSILDGFIDSDERVLVIDGPTGSGRSALVANWIKSNNHERRYLYHSIGAGDSGYDSDQIISRITSFVEREISNGNERPLVILDGNFEDLSTENYSKLMAYVFKEDNSFKVIVCHPEGEDFIFDARTYHVPVHHGKEYWRSFVNKYLSQYCKRLTSAQIEKIVANPMLRNNTYMKLFLDEVIAFGSYEKLDVYIEHLAAFSNEEEFFQNYISSLEQQYGENIIRSVLISLAITGNGLPEDNIAEIAGITPLVWSQLFSNIANLVVAPSGLVLLRQDSFTAAVEKKYGLLRSKYGEYDANTCKPYREKIIESLQDSKSTYAFRETGFQLNALNNVDELLDLCIRRYRDYKVSKDTYFNLLADVVEPNCYWDDMMFSRRIELLEHYIPEYLDYVKGHPERSKTIYKRISVLPIYAVSASEYEEDNSQTIKSLVNLADLIKERLIVIDKENSENKKVHLEIRDTLKYLLNGMSNLFSEKQILDNIHLLKEYKTDYTDCARALIKLYQERNDLDKAIAICEEIKDFHTSAKCYHMKAKEAFSEENYSASELNLLNAIEKYEELAKVNPQTRRSLAMEYKNLGLHYSKTGEDKKSTEAYNKAAEVLELLSNEDARNIPEYIKVKYIISHNNKLGGASDNDILDWYLDLAIDDDHNAEYYYGRLCERGILMDKAVLEAINWYRVSAESGHVAAQRRLGLLNYMGRDIPKNLSEAIKWFTKAADQGDTSSLVNLASIYYSGDSPDYAKAFKYYSILAEKGEKDALYYLASMYRDGCGVDQSYENAYKLFSEAATQGDLESKCELAKMYLQGRSVDTDEKKAFDLLRGACSIKSSEDCPEAWRLLGILYSKGAGCEKDHVEARACFSRASKYGDVSAMALLAEMYYSGKGGAIDLYHAYRWFTKAAEAGHVGAQLRLAQMLSEGLGVEKDLDKAVLWNGKALEKLMEQYGPYQPKVLRCMNLQAWYLYLQKSDLQKALQIALDVTSHVSAEIKPAEKASYFDTLAAIYLEMGELEKSIKAYSECFLLNVEAFGRDDSKVKDLEYKINQLKQKKNDGDE